MTDHYQRIALCIRHAIRLCMIARGEASTLVVKAVVTSAPRSEEQIFDARWREKSLCWQLLGEGDSKPLHYWAQHDYDETAAFWLQFYPYLPGSIHRGILDQLDAGADLFAGEPARPDDIPAGHEAAAPAPKESRHVLAFPFTCSPPEECENLRDGVFQLKLKAAQMLNDVAGGRYLMSTENIEAIEYVNKMCLEVGLTPLNYEPTD